MKCKWKGENRGWCVRHDAAWRIDRAQCESNQPVPMTEKARLIADIRSKLPIVAIGYPDLAVEISQALDLVEAQP